MRTLAEKLLATRTELQNAREQIKRQERENSTNAILVIGQRGEITALRRELIRYEIIARAAAAAIAEPGALGCSMCDAPKIDALRVALNLLK